MKPKFEKNVYLTVLSEQCNRYTEMVTLMEELLKSRDKDLNKEERNLLSISYNLTISNLRKSIRTLVTYEYKEKKKDESPYLAYIQEYKEKLIEEFVKKCKKVISIIDSVLLKRAKDDEAKVFYLKMKGDYNRYMTEYAEGDFKTEVSEAALNTYNEAKNFVKNLPVLSQTALGLTLNLSLYFYEVKNDPDTALKIVTEVADKADKELPSIDQTAEENKNAMGILNLIKENLALWRKLHDDG